MHRPIGVVLLAIGSGLAALYQLYLMLVYLGILTFTIGDLGREISYDDPQWGMALWSLLIAAIWIWVAIGFWNVRAYALQFGIFISLFTLIWGFFALLFGNTVEAQTIPWLLSTAVLLYLLYPGVQQAFVQQEQSRLTPEQIAAYQQLDAANKAAATGSAPGMGKPPEASSPDETPSGS